MNGARARRRRAYLPPKSALRGSGTFPAGLLYLKAKQRSYYIDGFKLVLRV